MQPLRIFIGYDHRQPIAYSALSQSILSRSSKPVAITPLVINQLPIKKCGLTPFTYSRFLVPWLCNYEGWGLFLDIDIILNDDISKLFDQADDRYSVLVSKNVKPFEWASVMLFNNAKCQFLTPEYIETADNLHTISWIPDRDKDTYVGDLPREWNHLVGYDTPRSDPSLIHYTQGIPAFYETDTCEHSDLWEKAHKESIFATSWLDMMGPSVHAANVRLNDTLDIKVPLYYLNKEGNTVNSAFEEKIKGIAQGMTESKNVRH